MTVRLQREADRLNAAMRVASSAMNPASPKRHQFTLVAIADDDSIHGLIEAVRWLGEAMN